MASLHEVNGGKGLSRVEIAQRAYDRAVAVMEEKKRILEKAKADARRSEEKAKNKTSERLAKALKLVKEARAQGLLSDDSDLGTDKAKA